MYRDYGASGNSTFGTPSPKAGLTQTVFVWASPRLCVPTLSATSKFISSLFRVKSLLGFTLYIHTAIRVAPTKSLHCGLSMQVISHLSVQATSHFTPILIRPISSCKAYLYPFYPPHLPLNTLHVFEPQQNLPIHYNIYPFYPPHLPFHTLHVFEPHQNLPIHYHIFFSQADSVLHFLSPYSNLTIVVTRHRVCRQFISKQSSSCLSLMHIQLSFEVLNLLWDHCSV